MLLLAFEKTLPPTANFSKPNPQLGLDGSPFRVQAVAQPWQARDDRPRRAAISAFGFGGINAHVLLEQEGAPKRSKKAPRLVEDSAGAVAIVGMEARFGPLNGLRAFQEAVLSGAELPGRHLAEVGVRAGDYRVPPKEIEEMLPQQLLMLAGRAACRRGAPPD